MSVMVTGGAGYIGAHVVRALRRAGRDIIVVDDLSTGRAERIGGAELVELDLARDDSASRLASVLADSHATSVIHFAAKKQVGESVRRPTHYYKQNVGGLVNVLDAMERAGVQNLVYSSSAAVYGMPDVARVDEATIADPINPYGQTKLVGEWLVRAAATAWGLRSISLRYFNVAGAASPDLGDPAVLNLVTMVLDRLSRDEAPQVFGDDYQTPDGTCVRDYVHVWDLALAHVAALGHLEDTAGGVTETFNVGTGRGASVFEVVAAIRAVSGLACNPVVTERRPGDPPALVAETGRIETTLGWKARYGLQEIIRSAWEAWQAGPRAIGAATTRRGDVPPGTPTTAVHRRV